MLRRSSDLFMSGHRTRLPDRNGDPLESVSNLFDVAILIGLGFMIVALSSFGLKELMSSEDLTVVKAPGTSEMEVIMRKNGKIERFKASGATAEGQGVAIGTVYRLESGEVVWVPK
ncbi:MAG: DUF2149 domain-containing protein [Coriobacteriales bacterium]|nr:DUF2149 domain-containing protein [Actinomycetes bacterium]